MTMNRRHVAPQNVNIDISEDTSIGQEVIQAEYHASMAIHVPSAWTAADIGFLACDTETGTFAPVKGSDGSRLKITTVATAAAGWYAAPAGVMDHRFLKLASIDTADESAEAQAADRALVVMLKS